MNKTFPFKRRGISFPIYWTPKGDYPGWTFRHPVSRKRISRASKEDILEQANLAADQIEDGKTEQETLTALQASQYRQACILAEKCGTSLLGMASEFEEAFEVLGSQATMLVACRHWVATGRGLKFKTVPDVVEELIVSASQDGVSIKHVYDLRSRLRKFAKGFPGPILSLRGHEMEQWFRVQAPNLRTRLNLYRAVSNLVTYSKGRYLPKSWEEFDDIKAPNPPRKSPKPHTPEDFEVVLRQAEKSGDKRKCVYLILRGMLGVRDAECFRVDASQIVEDHLIVDLGQNKVKNRRRLVPLHGTSKLWLEKYAPQEGLLIPHAKGGTFGEQMRQLFKDANDGKGVKRLTNGLRHGFVSYRMAQTKNANTVADESGNSPKKVYSDYREIRLPDGRIITEKLAAMWFAILPQGS